MSSQTRLTRAYNNAKRIDFDDSSKIILFSDCHRGDNSFADDFSNNRNIYFHALKQYYQEDYTYIELGDGDELWENLTFEQILAAHKNVYQLMQMFHTKGRLHRIWGNHDMVYRDKSYVKKHLYKYFDERFGCEEELFPDIEIHEAVVLRHTDTKKEIFLSHGHQADWWNYLFWRWSRFLVRILWKPLQVLGIADPTSPAKNYKELMKIERRIKKWIAANSNIMTIVGHTHRPRFAHPEDKFPFFNDGSCVHPRSITGIEIENGRISLIKWYVATTDDGVLKIERAVLEGPELLTSYQQA